VLQRGCQRYRLLRCSALQCVAVCYSVLQCFAICCSELQRLQCVADKPATTSPAMLQRVVVCCSVLQCVAVCYSVLQCVAVHYNVLQYMDILRYIAVSCSVLQRVAVCCSMLQHVAVCFSMLQFVAERPAEDSPTTTHTRTQRINTSAFNFGYTSVYRYFLVYVLVSLCGGLYAAVCCSAILKIHHSIFVGGKYVCYSVLQCVAVCCSVLQCVAVCCSAILKIHHSIFVGGKYACKRVVCISRSLTRLFCLYVSPFSLNIGLFCRSTSLTVFCISLYLVV